MADEGDVPPLEDMSDLLAQAEALREFKGQTTKGELLVKPNSKDQISTKINGASSFEKGKGDGKQEKRVENEDGKKPKSFGGMKKGFLFGSSSSSKTKVTKSQNTPTSKSAKHSSSTNESDIPYIKPKEKDTKNVIPEVQDALKAGEYFAKNTEWVTDDLLTKVQKNPVLSKAMTDPSLMGALTEFQQNPEAAMKKYQNNTSMSLFLKEFMGTLGDHFTKIGGESPQNPPKTVQNVETPGSASQGFDMSVRSSTNPNQATAEDERKIQDILANPEIKEILLDPRIQRLIEVLRTNPDKAQLAFKAADPEMRVKISKLIDAGLLQTQQ